MTVFRCDGVSRVALVTLTLLSCSVIQGPCQAQTDSAGVARYFAAVMQGDAAVVTSHLQQGVPLDSVNALGLTGLHMAAYQQQESVVRALLAPIAKSEKSPPQGRELTFDEYLDSISFDTYADAAQGARLLDAKTPQGMTALHLAIGEIREEEPVYARLVEAIVAAGADPNLVDKQGRAPLHRATELGYRQVVKVLLAHGADPLLQTSDGSLATNLTRDPDLLVMIAQAMANRSRVQSAQPVTPPVPATPDDGPPRIFVVDAEGNSTEISVETGGSLDQLNPAGMDPNWPSLDGGDFGRPQLGGMTKEYALSEQQEKLRTKLGFPDFFSIVFIEDDLGTRVIETRMETWIYMRGGKVFDFCDGGCVAIKECETPNDLSKTVIVYNPTQFVIGMTQQDIQSRFGEGKFTQLSLADQGFQSEGLRDLVFWSDGTVTLGFHAERLVTVQASCRAMPSP